MITTFLKKANRPWARTLPPERQCEGGNFYNFANSRTNVHISGGVAGGQQIIGLTRLRRVIVSGPLTIISPTRPTASTGCR